MKEKKISDSSTLNFWGALKFVNQFLDKLHLQLVLFYLGWLFDTMAAILSPILFGVMINQMVYYRNLPLFIQIGLAFFGLSVFSCIQYFLLYELYGHIWNELIYRVRCRMFSVVQKMDARSMTNANYGDVAQLIQWKVMECVNFIVRNVIHNINNYINILICLTISYIISPRIALVLTVMVPVSVFISYRYGKKIREEQGRNQATYGKYISWLYEVFHALKDIRLLGAQNRVNHLFHRHQNTLIETDVKAGIAALKAEHIIANANTIIQMALYTVLALLAFDGGLSIGSVIRNLNLHIHAGEKVALVGESGCGKTTLSYMLLGFYEPQGGQIKEVLIFDGTVRYNIMLGNENAAEEDLIRACKAAGIYDFIMETDNQFETVLGRNGRQLSGGQKQRIAIARVYLKNPPILIFDEATASLDNETEAQIHEAWKKVLAGRTAIIIAHRQSSVMLCDRVALLKDGCIVETGTPEELQKGSNAFRTLFAVRKKEVSC